MEFIRCRNTIRKRYNKTVFLNDLQLKFQETDPNYL